MSCSCGCAGCSTPDATITACACCEGTDFATPIAIGNRPSLSQLLWRVGDHGAFLSSMETGISRGESLRRLATRRSDDWTLGLMDAWASALDVLTFYQERWGQELFLGTALERRSMIELARLIGYQPSPGVAARVPLAFGLDDGPGSPRRLTIPVGTRAQSLPQAKDELPQSFETSQELIADVRFGELHPRLKIEHGIPSNPVPSAWIQGTSSGLRRGDALLWVGDAEQEGRQYLLRARHVEPRPEENRTLVHFVAGAAPRQAPVDRQAIDLMLERLSGTGWPAGDWMQAPDLLAELEAAGKSTEPDELIENVKQRWPREQQSSTDDFSRPGLYALRVRARPFGHNAPRRASLPTDPAPPTGDWDSGSWPINRSTGSANGMLKQAIHTDQSYPEILDGSWVVLRQKAADGSYSQKAYTVESASEESMADFGLSGKTSRLELSSLSEDTTDDELDDEIGGFSLRKTTIFCGAERLELAPLPIQKIPRGMQDLLLEELVPHMEPGRRLLIEGEPTETPGVIAREEVVVAEVIQGSHTWLVLETGLSREYLLQTVKIHGNVVEATHGESKTEVLGSGDASQPHQRFRLRGLPLTHTPDPNAPNGARSSLDIWVDGVRWKRAPSLYGLDACERAYTLRHDDQDRTWVQFGDGKNGARLPSGAENVAAAFRVGLGTPGLVGPGLISLLQSPPLGVRQVINPMASADAADPETVDDTRESAPLTVRTLGRAVSLTDFEDFSRSWAGVDKARADRLWDGSRRVIFVTVAGTDGAVPSNDLLDDLRHGLDQIRDPRVPLRLGAYQPLGFSIRAKLRVAGDRRFEDVAEAARLALESAFAFKPRRLGQGVRYADVIAVLHEIEGIEAVDVDALEGVSGGAPHTDTFGLVATPAHLAAGGLVGAQHLSLGPSWSDPVQLSPWPAGLTVGSSS